MDLDARIERKIRKYNPNGGMAETVFSFLAALGRDYPLVKEHVQRVMLMAEAVALRLKKDPKAALLLGAFHDKGKTSFPYHLFDGRQITKREHTELKKHSVNGFMTLKDKHLFAAYCAGIHHALYPGGYGLTLKDLPKNWKLQTVKKLLEISMIVAVCDDIDSACHRKTWINGNKEKTRVGLYKRLKEKFPDDLLVVRMALEEARKFPKGP